jgi:hypothetical protein
LAMYRDGQPFRDTAVVSAVSVEGEIRDDD